MLGLIRERDRGNDDADDPRERSDIPCDQFAHVLPARQHGDAMSTDVGPSSPTQLPLGRLLVRDKVALTAALFLVAVVLMAVFAPYLAPYDPTEQHLRDVLRPPAWHERGTPQ